MTRQRSILKVLVVSFSITLTSFGLQAQSDSAFVFEASYIGDAISNFSGGMNNASLYLGMIDIGLTINTNNIGLWENGKFYVQVENTHGGSPSSDLVCDIQCLSNIENGDHTYLYQLWYHHEFEKLSFTLGVHDLNSEFLTSDYSGEYINSSFGIIPTVSMNVPVSIFPKNALGFITRYEFIKNMAIQIGIYDGNPLDLEQDPYNMNFTLSSEEGFFSIGEFHYSFSSKKGLEGIYKLGGFYHSGDFVNLKDSALSYKGNYGLYLLADQKIIALRKDKSRGLGIFAQLGFAPKDRSMNTLFGSLGLNFYGPFSKRSNDLFGIAIAYAQLSKYLVNSNSGKLLNHEIAIECMYKLQINDNITFQPEVQYIINPGVHNNLNNAFVGLIRSYISF